MAIATSPDLSDIDLTDLETFVDRTPHDWFKRLRDDAPCFWNAEAGGRGFWSVTRYEDILALQKQPLVFSAGVGGTSLDDLTPEQVEARMSLLDMDPPRHTRLRALVNRGFTPKAVKVYEDRIRALIRSILIETMPEREFDFTERVSIELPMQILSDIMGTPLEDRHTLVNLGDRLLGNTEPEFVGDLVKDQSDLSQYAHLPFSSPAALEMFDYALGLADLKRAQPGEDVVTILINSELDGDTLSEHEFKLFFLLLITAGNETTRHTMSHGINALLSNRDQIDRLVANPELCGSAAEEIIRWATAVSRFRRVTRSSSGSRRPTAMSASSTTRCSSRSAARPTSTWRSGSAGRTTASARTSRASRSRSGSRSCCRTCPICISTAKSRACARTSSTALRPASQSALRICFLIRSG